MLTRLALCSVALIRCIAQDSPSILLDAPCVTLRGRWRHNADGSATLDWPGTGLTVAVNGGNVGLRLFVNASVPVRFKTADISGAVPESVAIAWPGERALTVAAGFGARVNHTFDIEFISDQGICGLDVAAGTGVTVFGLWSDGACATPSERPGQGGHVARPPTWQAWGDGFIPAGDDIFFENTTLAAGQVRCISTPGCAGITYQGVENPGATPVGVYFKSAWSFVPAAGWTSWQVVLHRRITFIGDSITAGTGAACAAGGGGDCDVQDHSATYAAMLASNFSAVEEALAFPGKGLVSVKRGAGCQSTESRLGVLSTVFFTCGVCPSCPAFCRSRTVAATTALRCQNSSCAPSARETRTTRGPSPLRIRPTSCSCS